MSTHLRDRLTAVVGEHYLIEGELGRGGMAAVFRALDVRLNRRVAIKLLPPEMAFNPNVRSRFLREAQMAAGLTHPHIVPIYTVDEREGLVYFIMAYVDGESVKERLTVGAMPPDSVRTIVSEVADALDYAHRQGVVHRDIKPDNILIERLSGRALVTDFGIARAAAEESRLTVTGMAVGTPAYMSPEQAMGEREVDGRSDIYSLGVVAYQMLAGETPFHATNTPAMLMKHVSETPPPLHGKRRDLPEGLVFAVERALAKKPEDRWETGAEFREALLDRSERPRSYEEPRSRQVEPEPAWPAPGPPPSQLQRNPAVPPGMINPVPRDRVDTRDRYEVRGKYRDQVSASPPTVEDRIARFRRRLAGYLGTSFMLFVVNMVTSPRFPWFIFPVLGMLVGVVGQLGSLWGDGVPLRRIFFGPNRRGPADALPSIEASGRDLNKLAPAEVLAGAHGPAIKRAAASQAVVADLIARMDAKDRKMLPSEIEETVKALLDRVVNVGITLHRLDSAANGATLGTLDARLQSLRGEPESTERERRLSLLERQRSTLGDLLERRSALLSQLESASIALENLKLDLVRFRSAGVSSALEDVTSATREARAVSRDIGHLLDAADEVRRL